MIIDSEDKEKIEEVMDKIFKEMKNSEETEKLKEEIAKVIDKVQIVKKERLTWDNMPEEERSKICKYCGKNMKIEDYIPYESYSLMNWRRRRYCSKKCFRDNERLNAFNKSKEKRTLLLDEHKRKIIYLNDLVKGEIVGFSGQGKLHGKYYIPDIIKEDIEYEVELMGSTRAKKFKKKWKNNRFDMKKTKKRILVIGVCRELINMFDETYIFDNYSLKNI